MKHGAICGKFRILHIAHKELMIQAVGKVDYLHVFLCDSPNIKRYASIAETKRAIQSILSAYDTPFTIHTLSAEELKASPAPSVAWDNLLLSKAGQLDVIFDSKEAYGNTLIHNEFIHLFHSKHISASDIEANPYGFYESRLIAPEFMQFMNKTVIISGINILDNVKLAYKLADFFQTSRPSLTQFNASQSLSTFLTSVETNEAHNQQLKHTAHRFFIPQTDPILTLFHFEQNYKTSVNYEEAHNVLVKQCAEYQADLCIYLYSNNNLDQQLIKLYRYFNIPLMTIEAKIENDYFTQAVEAIENTLNIMTT